MRAQEQDTPGLDGESYDQWLAWDHGLRRRLAEEYHREVVNPDHVEWGDQVLIDASLAIVTPRAGELVAYFYECLFTEQPGLHALFPYDLLDQRERLLGALVSLARATEPDGLIERLEQLGRDHRKFGARPAHYAVVGKALVAALSSFAGGAWTPAIEAAWVARYTVAANAMVAGAEADTSPPYWYASVVGHERCADDLAIIRLEPHQPFPYRAGQHATLTSDRLRRVWRPFTMATAPAANGELEFHVRGCGTGGLSDLLVSASGVGDTVRIGAAQGRSGPRPVSGRIQVFVASGLGWAPTKAFLEQLSHNGPQARAAQTVLIQVGRAYDPDWTEVRDRCPGLSTVVCGGSEDVLRCLAGIDPDRLEPYIGGGPAFTTAVSDGLARAGVAAEHLMVTTWPDGPDGRG